MHDLNSHTAARKIEAAEHEALLWWCFATGGAHAAPLRRHQFRVAFLLQLRRRRGSPCPALPPGTCSSSKRVHLSALQPSPAGRNDDDDRCHTWMETLVPKAIATLRSIPFRPVLRGRRGPAAPLAVAAPSLPGELPPRAPSPPLAVTWTSPPPPRPASIYTRPRLAVPFLLITLLSAAATYLAAPHTPPLHLHRRPTSALARMPAPLPIRQRHLDHPHPVF